MTHYDTGDYVKVEFKDAATGESERMWVCVESCDEVNQVVFGQLYSVPLLDHGGKLKLGSELAVSYSNIREHKKASDFTSTSGSL